MIEQRKRIREIRQKGARRRLFAFVSAFVLLFSVVSSAFAQNDEGIYSVSVTVPAFRPEETPAPEGAAEPEEEQEEKPEEPAETENAEADPEEKETEEEAVPESTPAIVWEAGSLTAEAEGCSIQMDYPAEACIPGDAVLKLEEAKGADLYAALKSAVKLVRDDEDEIWSHQVAEEGNRFWVVTLTDADGNAIVPETGVTLMCSGMEQPDGTLCVLAGENARVLETEEEQLTVAEYRLEPFGYIIPEKVQIGTVTLEYSAADYTVTASYGPEAAFPADTEMKVREIRPGTAEYALYSGMTQEALAEEWSEITLERFFDITFVSEGRELEPQADVDVQILFKDVIELTDEHDVHAVHIENNEAKVIASETDSNEDAAKGNSEAIDTVSFTSDSFSVFGVVQRTKITQKVLAADGNTYEINVTYGPEAGIPENAELLVEEIPEGSDLWEAYRKQTAAALGADDVRLPGLYDISILVDGQKIEPQVPVNVSIRLVNAEAGEELHIVHFMEEMPEELVDSAEKQTEVQPLTAEERISSEKITDAVVEGDTVTFDTDGFSVYAFAYTVVVYYRTASGDNYRITLDYDADAGIPAGAELRVEELLPGDTRYEEHLERAIRRVMEAEDGEAAEEISIPEDLYARFFDIEILSGGQKIEPTGPVSVTFELADAPEDRQEDLKVLHFTGDNIDIIDAEISADTGIRFETDAFSVYGVITHVDAQPQNVEDLDGRSFTISHNGYMTLNSYSPGGGISDYFSKSQNAGDAAVWYFEASDEAGKYNIFTVQNGSKKYLNLVRRYPDWASAQLRDEPQAFTVEKENNGRYTLLALSTHNATAPTEYYLYDRPNYGFTGHREDDAWGDSKLTLNFENELAVENSKSYMTLVKYNGKYYIVNNTGSLTEVSYDPVTKMVATEDPLLWQYQSSWQGSTLSIVTEGKTFNGPGGTADSYYNRYIDANADSGIYTEDAAHSDGSGESRFVFENNHIRSRNGSNYLGVELNDDGVPVRIAGNKTADEAVEVLFASVVDITVPSHYARNHAVTHLDVSIHGDAQLDYPLPRGTYYDENGNELYTIGRDNPKSITIREAVPITKDDIKNADIIATDKNGDVVDNAFYVTGYTGNEGDNDPSMPTQIRIEGSFLVASNVTTPYPSDWTGEEDEYWGALEGNSTHQAIRTQRKNSEITYTVTTTKMVEFTLTDGDQVLYDKNGQPITVEVPVTMTGSCSYWSRKNTCPGITYNGGFGENGPWASGCIVGNGGIDSSGIDFTLGGSTKQAENAYPSVDITKYIVDEYGNLLATEESFQNSFTVYQLENESLSPDCNPDYSAYTEESNLAVTVANGVGKNYYDLNVSGAMIYIEEDKASIPATVTAGGVERQYVKTVIETEYVRRDSANEPNHRTEDLTLEDNVPYNSIPELAGAYRYNNEDRNNAILNFYVYNVYTAGTELNVAKTWSDGADHYGRNELTLTLIRYKKNTQQTQETGILNLSHTVTGLDELPAGFVYTATSSTGDAYTLHIGENTLPLGTYTVTVNDNGVSCPTGYIYDGTEISPSSVSLIADGQSENVAVTSTYRVDAPVEYTTVILYINDSIQTDRNSNVNITLRVPKNSTIYLSCSTFVQSQWTSWDPGCSLLYWDEVSNPDWHHWTKVRDLGTTPMTNRAIQLGNEDDYCVLISINQVHSNLATYSLTTGASGRLNTVRVIRYRAASGAVSGGTRSSGSSLPEDYVLDSDYAQSVTLTQANSWQALVDGLPVCDENGDPYYYAVVEENVPEGYEVSYSSNMPVLATETEGVTLTVHNEYPTTGNLVVSKTAAGNAADYEKEFDFTVTAKDAAGNPIPNGQYGDMAFVNGVARFKLSHSKSARAEGLPEGTVFTVSEDPDGYEASREGNDGTIVAGQTKSVSFTNTLNTSHFFVKKNWVSVNDTSVMPPVFFSLMYYVEGQQPHEATVYNGYEDIELSGPGWTWACPEELPTEINGKRVTYFAKEKTAEGSNIYAYYDMSAYDIPQNLIQQYMFFIDGYQNSLGNFTAGNDQPYNAGITGNAGIITIRNRTPKYLQMDVKKKFLEYRTSSDGAVSLYTTTQDEANQRNMVIELQMMRRVIDERPGHSNVPLTGWEEYGSPFRVGHITSGDDYYIYNENVFEVEYAGSPWAFRIPDDNVHRGLPAYGFYKLSDGTEVPVRFQYVFKEVQVYDGNMNPIGGQWTSWLPEGRDGNGETIHVSSTETAQDPDRLLNVPGTSLNVIKEWKPAGASTDVEEVYVKIWRREYGTATYVDYLAIISQEMAAMGSLAQNHFETSGSAVFDSVNYRLILKQSKDWKAVIDKVDLFPHGNQAKQYEYLIEEVGYKDRTGNYNNNLEVFEPVTYYKQDGDDGDEWIEQPNILPTRTGTNSLKVVNTLQYGSLAIIKQVPEASTDKAAEESFVFNIALTLPAGTTLNLETLSVTGGTIGDEITVNGTSVAFTVTVQGAGTAVIDGIPYGTTYTVTEDTDTMPDGWEQDGTEVYSDPDHEVTKTDETTDTVTVTNKEITSVSVEKVWKLNGEETEWPEGIASITAGLYQSVNGGAPQPVMDGETQRTLTFNKDTDAEGRTFSGLPVYDGENHQIIYSVQEISVTPAGESAEPVAVTDGKVVLEQESWNVSAGKPDENGLVTITNEQFTADIHILKVEKTDGETEPEEPTTLSGAVFRLYRQKTDGSGYEVVEASIPVDENGAAVISGLAEGSYRLAEIKAPAGYIPLGSPVDFSVDFSEEEPVIFTDTDYVTYNSEDDTFTIGNKPGLPLPITGGSGTLVYYIAGLGLILLAAGLLMIRKRKIYH